MVDLEEILEGSIARPSSYPPDLIEQVRWDGDDSSRLIIYVAGFLAVRMLLERDERQSCSTSLSGPLHMEGMTPDSHLPCRRRGAGSCSCPLLEPTTLMPETSSHRVRRSKSYCRCSLLVMFDE